MGAVCGKSNNATPPVEEGGTLRVMFHRFDKDNKGFISTLDLQKMMRDDKTHFQGKDANHIMEKYGTDGKMTFTNFELWWNSTYTTYSDDIVSKLVDEVKRENHAESIHMEPIPEVSEVTTSDEKVISRS